MRHKMRVDAQVSFDLDFKGPEEGRDIYKTRPVVLALSTPDGIHCSAVDVEILSEESLMRITFKADGKIGQIGLTMSLLDFDKIAVARVMEGDNEKEVEA
jgi:hypothetical protein